MARPCPAYSRDAGAPQRLHREAAAGSPVVDTQRLGPPALARTSGIYREQPPPAALASHFKCLWLHRMPDGVPSNIAVVPDGCCDIIWSSKGLALVGPDRTAAFPKLPAGETIIGARFRIGAAASWLRKPLRDITGQTVPLNLLWDCDTDEIEARMREAASTPERLGVLAVVLLERLWAAEPQPPDIAACVARLQVDRLTVDDPIRTLVREIVTSERTLRRRCHEHLGYGAKTLDRILRLQRFLTACHARPGDTLANLALDAGYADQAHLAREARELTSFTPREIQRQLTARFGNVRVENFRTTT
ncbi:AraC family transcriptional regulator [Mesorhizobium plurifarium]|uniref:helix-turn-helix domain-containing protein n=1 Tax=Sinorhizobium arboris TaxID=76745 RepID=UPI000482A7AE|nr:helix-turn-helix domain-containing protein [Sinorhizobium arboris]PST21914.1 AraC family transcriptional regulator [Mesorhizobium plurifarium]